jgi:hypothetical protein
MYARTATLRGKPDAIDQAISFVRDDWLPTTTGLDGCTGMSMLVARRTGRCIVTKILGAVPVVAQYEVAVMHRAQRAGEHACCRVTWSALRDPELVDEDITTFRMALLPRIEELVGFASASLMVDRLAGRAALAVNYVDREAMRAAGQRADALQEQYAREMGGRITEVAELDLVVAHLRIPETV